MRICREKLNLSRVVIGSSVDRWVGGKPPKLNISGTQIKLLYKTKIDTRLCRKSQQVTVNYSLPTWVACGLMGFQEDPFDSSNLVAFWQNDEHIPCGTQKVRNSVSIHEREKERKLMGDVARSCVLLTIWGHRDIYVFFFVFLFFYRGESHLHRIWL